MVSTHLRNSSPHLRNSSQIGKKFQTTTLKIIAFFNQKKTPDVSFSRQVVPPHPRQPPVPPGLLLQPLLKLLDHLCELQPNQPCGEGESLCFTYHLQSFCYPKITPKNNHHVPLKSIATTHGHPSMAWQRIQSLPQTGLCDGEPTTSVAMSLNSRSFQHLPSHPTHPASPLCVGLLDGMLPLS